MGARADISGVTLHGRADRLDELPSGGLLILDYKTGSLPSAKNVLNGSAPQLPLEALLASRGGFLGVSGMPSALEYWRLAGGEPAGEVLALEEVAGLIEQAEEGFDRLAKDFLRGSRAFAARPDPGRVSLNTDYDHLSRRAEWEVET